MGISPPFDRSRAALEALHRGFRAHQGGDFETAERFYAEALAQDEDNFDALNMMGVLRAQCGRREEAASLFQRAIKSRPDSPEVYVNLGRIQCESGDVTAAFESYRRALALKPDFPLAHSNYSILLRRAGRYEEALAHCDRALALRPDYTDAMVNRGNVLAGLERYPDALAAYDAVIALAPDTTEAWLGRADMLFGQGRFEESCAAYRSVVSARPSLMEAWLGQANALYQLGRLDDALAAFQKASSLAPASVEAWIGSGNALAGLRRPAEALVAYDEALRLNPLSAGAWVGRGNACLALRRFDEASAAYDHATANGPDMAEGWYNRGHLFVMLGQDEDAYAAYARALALKPDLEYLAGDHLTAKLRLCDWAGLDDAISTVLAGVRQGKRVATPFCAVAIGAAPADQLACARQYLERHLPRRAFGFPHPGNYVHDRIRVAYLSADFRTHPTSALIVGLLECHDRSRFEVTAVSYGPDDHSDMRARVATACERFIDVERMSDIDTAKLLRHLEIDIAVDLMGHTRHVRAGILAHRPVPISVNYLGYPGTSGADHIDYIIADRFVIPDAEQQFYSEAVVRLPDCYQVNDSKRKMPDRTPTRSEAGLPERAFVFCSFNSGYKLTPTLFDAWMRLLAGVDSSVLWLLAGPARMGCNLRREAEHRGISGDRLIFAPIVSPEDHLARHGLADLFLDALPCNAHTTASDALWAGLPLITCVGSTFAGRVAASLLHAAGVPELITGSLPEYEQLALRLASDRSALAAFKDRLNRKRATSPLFDTDRFRRHIEAAYLTMSQRRLRNELPESFQVDVAGATAVHADE